MKKITYYFTLIFLLAGMYATAQFSKLYDLELENGAGPYSNLLLHDEFLYGVTVYGGEYNNGTIFKIKPDGSNFTKIFDFNPDISGSHAYSTLISDGTFLYGMTKGDDGSSSHGTIYKIMPDGTNFSTLHSFDGANGSSPWSALLLIDDYLYGMTNYGAEGDGSIFKIRTDGTFFSTLFSFSESTTGRFPYGEFYYDGTFLYGTTAAGGTNFYGTVFKILPDGTGYTKLTDFSLDPNGNYPYGSLISDGTFLYGLTGTGGTIGYGTIFKIKPNGTDYQTIYNFSNEDGATPMDNLVAHGPFLYGMAIVGGIHNMGTLYRIKPDGTEFTKILDFDGTTYGNYPRRSLISDGTFLYGMTSGGGANGWGVVFKISPEQLSNAEVSNIDDVTIYPNPSHGIFTIDTGSSFYSEVEVYNVLGQLISTQEAHARHTDINLINHESGLYVIKMTDKENNIMHKKILKL
jgi:uncharacterized repeat protein (TIGR03803 family)